MDISTLLGLAVALLLGVALGALIGVLWARGRADAPAIAALEQRSAETAVVRDGLDRLQDQLSDLAHDRAAWQAALNQQVSDMRHSTDALRRETQSLSTALRRPQVRGRWGELHLRKAVELAGMVAHCDFTEQAQLADGSLRPDLVVHLAGGRQVVVDSKVPLEAFLDATSADEPDARDAHLARHARQLRTHVDALGAKSYWRALTETPEFVVLFVPAEAFLSAALEADPALLEHAATRKVVLATPSTLIALLRTVAHGWTHERLAEQAAQVHALGRELHERLTTMGNHVDKVGRSLSSAVTAYNQAVGSLEGRVLVSARRLADLGVTTDELVTPRQVAETPRSISAPEFLALEEVASRAAGPTDEALIDLVDPDREGFGGPDDPARRARGA
jgi:DNA recombination protein RmuC